MLQFTWEYSYERGGALVYVTSSEGVREEVAHTSNGNVAQILCNALAAESEGKREGSVFPWMGYVNPPRPPEPERPPFVRNSDGSWSFVGDDA